MKPNITHSNALMALDGQSICLMTVQAAVAHAKDVFKKLRGMPGQSVVDDFIAERRTEASPSGC